MIRVAEYKHPQHDIASAEFLTPGKLYLPLCQHIGKPAQELAGLLKKTVEEGELIAEPAGNISACIHAPSGGKVIGIDSCSHPALKRAKCVVIECSPGEKTYPEKSVGEIARLSAGDLTAKVREAGVVGMGGACFPSHVKLNPPKSVDILLINGCECEPYLACDYRLMVEETKGIFLGVSLVSRIIKPKEVIFCIEENKPQAIKNFNLYINAKKYDLPPARLAVLNSRYPKGGEKQLIYKVTGRTVPSGKLPLDAGCLVQNVATCFAVYEAVYRDKPLIDRMVTFAGKALKQPKNLRVKIGTMVRELFDRGILEFNREPERIICGGPMMGTALDSLDYPVLKGTSGFLFLSPEEIDSRPEGECIRCGRCVDNCPMGLVPLEYVKRVKKKEFSRLKEVFINDCIECGCCAFSCPAKIPVVHYIKAGKKYAVDN